MSKAEQDWIEKYRAALLASAQTEESRFRSVVKAIAKAVISPLRKISGRRGPVEPPQTPATKIVSGKNPSSQPQRKKKAS